MQTFIRITLLGIFVAAGIGLAVGVAKYKLFLSYAPGQSRVMPPWVDEEELSPIVEKPAEPARLEPSQPTRLPAPILPVANHSPQLFPVESQVADKIDRLETKLDSIRDAAERDKMSRLELKLAEMEAAKQNGFLHLENKLTAMEAATRHRQQQFEQSTIEHQRNLAESARQQQQFLMTLAQAVTEEKSNNQQPAGEPGKANAGNAPEGSVESLPAPLPNNNAAGSKPIPPASPSDLNAPRINKGEGDDGLYLTLKDDDLRNVLEFLSAEGGMNILAMDSVKGKVTATLSNVDVRTALAAILKSTGYIARYDGNFVYVGTQQDFQRLDQQADQIGTNVYRTNYVTAAELQKHITPLLTQGIGVVTVSSPSKVSIPSDRQATGGDDFAGNEVLMVRDYKAVLAMIDEVVAKVDKRPRQVAIEAMILSVNLDDKFSLGVNFEFLRNKGNVTLASGTPLSSLGSINFANGGLSFGFLDSGLGSFINALETFGDVDVIASPHLMCLNKQRAEILIGDQKGYVSTTQTETATTQTVEFLDIGTQLLIRPFISADGMVRLEIHPELSTGDVKLLGGFALPEKSTTQVTTNIMCRDGCTVVLGGLIREDLSKTTNQVPFLGNVPLVGAIFRNRNDVVTRNEIIVLITPRIIQDPGQCEGGYDCVGDLAQRQAKMQASKLTKVGRYHYGRRYLRLAQTAYRAGNLGKALEYIDLALNFNPDDADACYLKCQIQKGVSGGFEIITDHPVEILDALPPNLESLPPEAIETPVKAASHLQIQDAPEPGRLLFLESVQP